MTPSDHDAVRAAIGAHFAGRATPATETTMRAHLTGCPACRRVYRRHHLLAQLDPTAVPVEARIGRALGFRSRRPAPGRFAEWALVLVRPAAAIAVAAIALVVFVRPHAAVDSQEPVARGASVVASQTPHLLMYRFAMGTRVPELVSRSIRSGDELAFAYTNPAGRRYVAILGVDEHRRVYWFHPAWPTGTPPPVALPTAVGPGPHEIPEAIRHVIGGRRLVLHTLLADRALGVEEIEAAIGASGEEGALASRLGGDIVVVDRNVDVSP